MNLQRATTLVVVGGAFAAWLAAAATSGIHDVPSPSVSRPSPAETRGAELAAEIARLHERLRPTTLPRHGRNLFEFASTRPASAPVAHTTALAEPVPMPAPSAPAPPPLTLVGVAEDAGPDGLVRTAIISGLGQLFIVKEDEAVTLRYRVARISADVVELADESDGSVLRLALR
jgi:hypothetical protein